MSAIGTLVIRCFSFPREPYQLALITPGISPFNASCRKHRRQMPNLRRKPRGRPQRQQRLRCRQRSFGVFLSFALSSFTSLAILAVVAIVYSFLLSKTQAKACGTSAATRNSSELGLAASLPLPYGRGSVTITAV